MPEDLATAESVTGIDASVAIDPATLNKPVFPEADGNDDLLKHKLSLANSHAKKAKQEAEEYRKQLDNLGCIRATIPVAQICGMYGTESEWWLHRIQPHRNKHTTVAPFSCFLAYVV